MTTMDIRLDNSITSRLIRDGIGRYSNLEPEGIILYENASCYVIDGGRGAFEVYENTSTHAVRVASIGCNYGLERAIREADKRHINAELYRLRDADSPTGYDTTQREYVAELQERYNQLQK